MHAVKLEKGKEKASRCSKEIDVEAAEATVKLWDRKLKSVLRVECSNVWSVELTAKFLIYDELECSDALISITETSFE